MSFRNRWIVLLLAMFLTSPSLWARTVTLSEVQAVARNWIAAENAHPEQRLTPGVLTLNSTLEWTSGGLVIGYLVELQPRGFLIVPAVTDLAPVTFISFSANYAEVVDAPFLQVIQERLRYAVTKVQDSAGAKGDQPPDPVQRARNEAAWSSWLSGPPDLKNPGQAVPPLLASRWNQRYPYNLRTPMVGYQHTPTGCSATAQAQVMYYWRYPSSGQGEHSYEWNGQTLAADFNHPYLWDLMLDVYTDEETWSQKDAVAHLMSDVGISIDMNYGLDGSAAAINANDSLTTFFQYSTDAAKIRRRHYTSWSDWYYVFQNQLNHGWPAILATYNDTVGHAVVIDGCREAGGLNQVHVNMGWGGSQDNYYTVDNIYGFGSDGDSAVVNIHPPTELPSSQLNVSSLPTPGAWIKVSPRDNYGYSDEQTNFTRTYHNGLELMLTAFPYHDGKLFQNWKIQGEDRTDRTIPLRQYSTQNAVAVYSEEAGTIVTFEQALDNLCADWMSMGGVYGWGLWFGLTGNGGFGGDAARSGELPDNARADLIGTVTGPATLRFDWKVSSEAGYDYLRWYIDEQMQGEISGEMDWQTQSAPIPDGNHSIRWTYEKDGGVQTGADCGWIDHVELIGAGGTESLYFPRLAYHPGATTEGYGFVNTGQAETSVRFTSFDASGNQTGLSAPMTWGAGCQGAFQAEGLLDLFWPGDSWVIVQANLPGLRGFFLSQQFADNALVAMDGAPVFTSLVSDGIFPWVSASGEYSTELFLSNPHDEPVDVTIRGFNESGVGAVASRTLPPRGLLKLGVAELFAESPAFCGCLRVESGAGIIGNALVRFADSAINSINLMPLEKASQFLVAAHITHIPGVYSTTVHLVNPGDSAAQLLLVPYNANGSPMGSPIDQTLGPHQAVSLRDTQIGLPDGVSSEGYLSVTSQDQPVLGCVTFGDPVAGRYESTLPLQAEMSQDIYFAQVANGTVGSTQFFTGVAVVNPSLASPAQITISVRARDGSLLGSVTRSLGPGEKYARLLSQIEGIGQLPDVASGYLHLSSSEPVFAFELFGDEGLNFLSAVPASF